MIMRDERCAETMQRLLDDLTGLLLSRKAGDRGGNLVENVEEKVRGRLGKKVWVGVQWQQRHWPPDRWVAFTFEEEQHRAARSIGTDRPTDRGTTEVQTDNLIATDWSAGRK